MGRRGPVGTARASAQSTLCPVPCALCWMTCLSGTKEVACNCGNVGVQGILVELPLAGFVLKKLLGQAMGVTDLPSLDNDLYRSLMLLRDYEGNVEDLCLNFTINRNDLEEHVEVCSG